MADSRSSGGQKLRRECRTDEEKNFREGETDGHSRGSDNPRGGWAVEPSVGRVAHGIPNRVDRLKQLGNAVVPQIVEQIGRAIMEIENAGNNKSENS